MSDQLFIARSFLFVFIFNIHRSGVLTALAWLVPHETAVISARSVYPNNHAPCHFMQSHIRKVFSCLAVTCHQHFQQNDQDLLHATAVTRGWNGYRNNQKSVWVTCKYLLLFTCVTYGRYKALSSYFLVTLHQERKRMFSFANTGGCTSDEILCIAADQLWPLWLTGRKKTTFPSLLFV